MVRRTDARQRLARQLQKERTTTPPVAEVLATVRKARREDPSPRSLGIEYMTASLYVGIHGEMALLKGDERGWGLLRAARHLRALRFFLAPSVASARPAALALLDAIQWRRLTTARAIAGFMSKGYAGDWHISGPMLPTDTELDALAFGLLVPLLKARGVEGRFRTPELVPLKSFAGIAGKRRVPLRQAFEEALGTYEGMCKDGAEVPPGAQLSAAPVFACVSLRLELGMPVPGDDDPVTHPLYASPFKDFMDFIDYPIDQRVAGELQHGHDVATGLGFTLDPP